MPTVLRY